MKFGYDDIVSGNLAQIIGNGPVGGDSSLKNHIAIVMEQQFSDAGNNGSRLCATGSGDNLTERIAVLELIDGGRAQNGADAGKFKIGIVIDFVRHFFDGNIQFECDTVKERSGSGGTDATHLRGPHLHSVIVDHRLAVLPADIQNRTAVRIIVKRTGDMRGNFTDLKVEIQEFSGIFHDLTAGHNCAADILHGQPRFRKKFFHGLLQSTEIAVPAVAAPAGAGQLAGFHGTGSPVDSMRDFAIRSHQYRFECC